MTGNGVVVLVIGLLLALFGAVAFVRTRQGKPVQLGYLPKPTQPGSRLYQGWVAVTVLLLVVGLFLIGISFTQ